MPNLHSLNPGPGHPAPDSVVTSHIWHHSQAPGPGALPRPCLLDHNVVGKAARVLAQGPAYLDGPLSQKCYPHCVPGKEFPATRMGPWIFSATEAES